MKKLFLSIFFFFIILSVFTQSITAYNKQEMMIPMRDGVKLYTVIFTPKEKTGPLPVLMQRTPYGASVADNYNILAATYLANMAKEGYIFVVQDIRGKYK